MNRKNSWQETINDRSYGVYYSNYGPIKVVTIKEYRSMHAKRLHRKCAFWYRDTEEFIATTLSEAVANRERSIEKRDDFDERIGCAMETVKEAYEDE